MNVLISIGKQSRSPWSQSWKRRRLLREGFYAIRYHYDRHMAR